MLKFDDICDVIGEIPKSCDNIEIVNRRIRKIKTGEFNSVLYQLTGQSCMTNKLFSTYSYSLLNFDIIETMKMFSSNEEISDFILGTSNDCIILNAIEPELMNMYLDLNKNNRFVCFSLSYEFNNNNGHQAVIAFDNVNKYIYILDPNIVTSYFNEITQLDCTPVVEMLVEYYVKKLNGYTYVPISHWCTTHYSKCPNRLQGEYTSGNCVAMSILIAYILRAIEIEPENIYESISNISDDELAYVTELMTRSSVFVIVNS